jgi:hypothetical protein
MEHVDRRDQSMRCGLCELSQEEIMATQATIGIMIATPGRKSLWRTLQSIAYQGAPVEDVLVVGDGFHKATAELVEVASSTLKLPVRYVATEKTRDFGHSQLNYALQHVRGDYITYQDDDDCYVPRALTEMVKLVSEFRDPHPLIGRIKTPNLGLLWPVPGTVLDGHCLVVPNDKKKLGFFTSDYSGDQAYIHHSLRPYKEIAWTDRIWTLTRPAWRLWPQVAIEGSLTWTCDLCREDNGVPGAVIATVLLELDDESDRVFARVNGQWDIKVEEYMEIAQFLVYAAQSKDVWIRIRPIEGALDTALRAANFKEHARTTEYIEFTHDWPPDFWKPIPPFNETFDPDSGARNLDWRDAVWGRGRRIE